MTIGHLVNVVFIFILVIQRKALQTVPRCVSNSLLICVQLESFIEFMIPRANQNPVMQYVCPNGLHTLVHLAREMLCILLICLVSLILNVPVNNITVMLGRGHGFLGITNEYFWEKICLAQGHNIVT